MIKGLHGCFYKLGVLLVGVLAIRALLFGVVGPLIFGSCHRIQQGALNNSHSESGGPNGLLRAFTRFQGNYSLLGARIGAKTQKCHPGLAWRQS